MKRFVAVCAVLVIATTAYAGDAYPLFYRWVIGPASLVERCQDSLECTANNGWALCEQTADGNIGRIHIVYTKWTGRVSKVYTRYTTDRGKSWSSIRNLSYSDSARDAAIACLGCTLAVAFSDIWRGMRHMMYAQDTGRSGTRWLTYGEKPLSDDDTSQFDNRHPSVAVTWRAKSDEDSSDARYGALARIAWIDSVDATNPRGRDAWMTEFTVNMHKLGTTWWEEYVSDSWAEYPSVCWNGVRDKVNDAWFAFEGIGTAGSDHEIFVLRSIPNAGKIPKLLTDNACYDGRPCIQILDTIPPQDPNGSERMDTVITVYESKPGNRTRIYRKRWHFDSNGIVKVDTSGEAFPNWNSTWNIGRPNIWRRHYPPNNANDTVFMVFAGEYPTGLAQFWSISINRGDNWKTPERVVGPISPNASIIGGYRYANILASLHYRGWHYLVFFPVSYVNVGEIGDDAVVAPTGRLLQRDASCSPRLWCVGSTGEYPLVLTSTDNGLNWENYGSPGWGDSPALSLDSDTMPVAAFMDSNSLYCSQPTIDKTIWCPIKVYEAVAGEVIRTPSVALYPGKVSGVKVAAVTFAVYDTVAGTSKIMFAKVDTGTVILDTIDTRNDLTDSFPCISIANTDSVYVTYQRGTEVVGSALFDYAAASTERPPVWKALGAIGEGYHPMSEIEGGILHCVWTKRVENNNVPDTMVISHSTFDVSDSPQFSGWQAGATLSCRDTTDKANPVYAGIGVTVWNELVNGKWAIKAKVRDSIRTFVANSHNCRYPQALAESSAISPSIDQIRLAVLWYEEVAPDTTVLGFKVDSFNISHARANATSINNGTKLIRKANSDSLFAVYTALDGAVMFARSANGDSWKRDVLAEGCEFPAIAEDGTGRKWAVMNYTGNTHANGVEARYLNTNDTWSNAQTVYSFSKQGSAGPVAIAATSDGSNPCCYAAFLYNNGAGNKFLIVAKFNGDSLRIDTVANGSNLGDPAIAVEPDAQGDYLHLVWSDNGEVKYTMSESRIQANNWSSGFPSDWKDAINLSNSQVPSVHPVIGANESRVVVSWAEGVIPDVFARQRLTSDDYNNWQEAVNLSNTQDYISDYPTIAIGDTVLISYQEEGENGDYDIMVAVEFNEPLNICDNPTASTYPQVLFQKKPSGDTTIPYLHCIWSEEPSQNYYEVRYHKLNLKQTGGGGQQSGAGFELLAPRLYQSAPNPFSTRMQIRYQIGQEGDVRLKVYDIQGRLVKSLVSAKQRPGSYSVIWDGSDERNQQVPNGIYFYRIYAPGINDTKKAVLMR